MRSKKKILQKLIEQFSPQANELPQINEYTTEVYNKLMKGPNYETHYKSCQGWYYRPETCFKCIK